MVRKYHHAMSTLLKANSSINNETLSTTDAEIRMKEDYRAFIFGVSSHGLRTVGSSLFWGGRLILFESDEVRLVGVCDS